MVKRLKKVLQKLYKWLLPLCYAVWVLVWLVLALMHMAGDGMRTERQLAPADGRLENARWLEGGAIFTESIDPQLIFEGLDEKVRTVRLSSAFSLPEGEMELFYTRKAGQGFSPKNRAIGAPQPDGSYLYALPAGGVHALRIDLGGANESRVEIGAITLNPRLAAARYLVPAPRDIVAALVIPGLACCVLYTIIEGVKSAPARRLWRRLWPKKAGVQGTGDAG